MDGAPNLSRAERRERSRGRILSSASKLFTESGYDRTTIRAIAADAEVDPALVLQHFGSKEKLFREAVAIPASEPFADGPDRLVELLLDRYGVKLGELPDGTLALLRSMLTYPEAKDRLGASIHRLIDQISAAIPSEDARLRATLVVTTLLGAIIGRHLLDLDALRASTSEEIVALLRPCFRSLTDDGRL